MKANGDRRQFLIGMFVIFLQFSLALFNNFGPLSLPWKFFLNICIGSWLANWIFLSIHEATHGLVFGPCHPVKNRLYALFLNLFVGFPFYSFFKTHHIDHHKWQGVEHVDVEYPTRLEVRLFNGNAIRRFFFLTLNPFLQHFRAWFVGPNKHWHYEDIINYASVIGFDVMWGMLGMPWISTHLLLSCLVASGCSLIGLWAVGTHTLFFADEETISYYGWLNPLYLNFGYHMEHHDFPNIPGRYLPQVIWWMKLAIII